MPINQIGKSISISRERTENISHNELGMTKVPTRTWACHLTTDKKRIKPNMSRGNLTLFQADPPGFFKVF